VDGSEPTEPFGLGTFEDDGTVQRLRGMTTRAIRSAGHLAGCHDDIADLGQSLGRMKAKAVIVAEVERLRWRIWNGKAKNAQRGIDRIRKVNAGAAPGGVGIVELTAHASDGNGARVGDSPGGNGMISIVWGTG
jgi:hypothetical protein